MVDEDIALWLKATVATSEFNTGFWKAAGTITWEAHGVHLQRADCGVAALNSTAEFWSMLDTV